MIFSYVLIVAIIVHIICQIYKLIYYSIKEKKFTFKYFISAGGMPSTHSAFTSALTISLGLKEGFHSYYFAIAFVFSAVVIYDSLRLRGAVQLHAEIIKRLIILLPKSKRIKVPQMVGHTLLEIIIGILIAFIISFAAYLLI